MKLELPWDYYDPSPDSWSVGLLAGGAEEELRPRGAAIMGQNERHPACVSRARMMIDRSQSESAEAF